MNVDNKILDLGHTLTEGCIAYYDLVNNTDNCNICLCMSADVTDKSTGQKYRYTVKIEKEGFEND